MGSGGVDTGGVVLGSGDSLVIIPATPSSEVTVTEGEPPPSRDSGAGAGTGADSQRCRKWTCRFLPLSLLAAIVALLLVLLLPYVSPGSRGVVQLVVAILLFVIVVALMLTMLGLHRLWNHRHPRFGGMQVGFRDLTVWSFLMASAHGAGFMVVPFVMSAPSVLSAAGHEHAHHIAAAAGANVAAAGMMAAAVHTLAYFAVMTIVAWGVYGRLGLNLLRKAWFNMDWVWAGALVLTGVIVLLK